MGKGDKVKEVVEKPIKKIQGKDKKEDSGSPAPQKSTQTVSPTDVVGTVGKNQQGEEQEEIGRKKLLLGTLRQRLSQQRTTNTRLS